MRSNNNPADTALYNLNKFSLMTEEEKSQFRGMNSSHILPNTDLKYVKSADFPASKNWVDEGAVTAIQNQGRCGSCYAWGAVGALESRYYLVSGKLRAFSPQEYMDCTIERGNGCNGGYPNSCYWYSQVNGGRLVSAANYPYKGLYGDGKCRKDTLPDDMVAAKISGYKKVAADENANIEALQAGTIISAVQIEPPFYQYAGGIFRDETCKPGLINHAMVTVGYTPQYVLVKNTFGKEWGEMGFIRYPRGRRNCELFNYSSFPLLKKTGITDRTPSDEAAVYSISNSL